MRTLHQVYRTLRRKNKKQYYLLAGCIFFSVLLISSLAIMMRSNTVQTMLPEGGDSRKQMNSVFTLAILGCAVFTTYASSLFFRSKSKESGVFMALGATKGQLTLLLLRDIAFISSFATVTGLLLATPLAAGIWYLFRLLIIDSVDMVFSINITGYWLGVLFSLFCMLMLFIMALRFIRRTNIMDILNEQRKSEPIHDVKSWYGWVGIVLMVVGGILGYFLPSFFVRILKTAPPFWAPGVYVLFLIGMYLLLVYLVVKGWGKKNYYKTILSRSMMKFQGRQTVRNMCVIALLIVGAYFAIFFLPMNSVSFLYSFSQYKKDFAFHYRADENMPSQQEIEKMATEDGLSVTAYSEANILTLATDGYNRDWAEDGSITNDYVELLAEKSFISEESYNRLTGQQANVQPGHYILVRTKGDSDSPYDYLTEITKLTNPVTMQPIDTSYQESVIYPQLYHYFVLDDTDFESLAQGLPADWQEMYVQFDLTDTENSYPFANRLKNELIDRSSPNAAIYNNYDRIEKRAVNATGEAYRGDIQEELQVDFAARDSSEFYMYWKYIPQFRILDVNDLMRNFAVFLMLFTFLAIVCFSAVIVIAYTRCLTIALINKQVYEDLRHLGASRTYLYKSVKGQVRNIFFIPYTIGTITIFTLFCLIMFGNSGSFDTGEILGLGMDLGLIAIITLLFYGVYRFTLKKVCHLLHI